MVIGSSLRVLTAGFCISVTFSVAAQPVYKCGARGAVVYSQQPCPGRTIDNNVLAKPGAREADLRRREQNRAMARAMRPLPGESNADFRTRRRRAGLAFEDRAECDRLDTRIPVEEARLGNPDTAELLKAEAGLGESRKRFGQLRC